MKNSLKGRKVLLRIDINSAIEKGRVADSPRMRASAKTIKRIIQQGARLVIIAHQGRKGSEDFTSLKQHARMLTRQSGKNIRYVDDLFGKKAKKEIQELKNGEGILLENLRAYEEETKPLVENNQFIEFSKFFDLYINEAFSASHREHSSIIIPPRYIPSTFGPEFEKETTALDSFAIHKNYSKTTIILGGNKTEDYMPLFKFLNNKTNKIIAGGVIGNILLKIRGIRLGYEEKWLKGKVSPQILRELIRIDRKHSSQIILPCDFALAGNRRIEVDLGQAPFRKKIMDVGQASIDLFKAQISNSHRIIMKGPLGLAEIPQFEYATSEVLKHLSYLHAKKKIPILVGGGHLTTESYKKKLSFTHISTAGGATIKYLTEGPGGLPGIEAIKRGKQVKIF
jgi:phosphoglycerate kinase